MLKTCVNKHIRIWIILLAVFGLALLFASGLAIRRIVLNAQLASYKGEMPFTLESALQYRLVKKLFDSGCLPDHDSAIQVPEGISLRETYLIGAEFVYAILAKFMPRSWSLTYSLRWISASWFCLGIPLMSLWLWWWLKSAWAAGIGGGYYALSLASVMRSTGQELSHENFALPLLIGHLALYALAESKVRIDIPSPNQAAQPDSIKRSRSGKLFWFAALLSAAFLGCAIATWDLIQFYVLLWALLGFVRFIAGSYFNESRHRVMWLLCLLALVVSGFSNPYLRAHAFVTSYAMLLAYGVTLGMIINQYYCSCAGGDNALHMPRSAINGKRRIINVFVALLPLVLGILLFKAYENTYNHFLELLFAKIIFFNQKPVNPALLTFNQSILWTPPLNSVNIILTGILFPVMIPLLFLTLLIILFNARWRTDLGIIQLLFYGTISFAAFILFMRFHVFLVIFGAALLGWAGCWACAKRRLLRWIIIAILLSGIAAESAHVLDNPVRWGRGHIYLTQQQELAKWMRNNTLGEPVLANFGVSAFLLTYGKCAIVLHPKYESPEIRKRIQEYGEMLFHSNEAQFREWADKYGTRYFVYSLGEFSDLHPEWQMRYFVDALHPPTDAAARLFEKNPENLRYFIYLWGNSKYRVFRMISRFDEQMACKYAEQAQTEFSCGALDSAEIKAMLSLVYNPHNEQAMKMLLHVSSLRESQ